MPGERVDGTRHVRAERSPSPDRLIAQRLREAAAMVAPPPAEPLSPYAVQRWLDGDAGHLHRVGDLRTAPIISHRRVTGRAIVTAKRAARRLLYPLIDVQSGINAANARVITFLLVQLAAQSRCIDELERRVAQLQAERDR